MDCPYTFLKKNSDTADDNITRYDVDYNESRTVQEGVIRPYTASRPDTLDGMSTAEQSTEAGNGIFWQATNIENITLEGFYFESGATTIDNPPHQTLDVMQQFYQNGTCTGYDLYGYTDNRGNGEMNIRISKLRAEFVQSALVEIGIPADDINVIPMGDDSPIGSNDTEAGRAMNRRVEFSCMPQ